MGRIKLATERIKLVTEGTKLVAGLSKPEASHCKLALERLKLAMARPKLARGGRCALPRRPKPGKGRREPHRARRRKTGLRRRSARAAMKIWRPERSFPRSIASSFANHRCLPPIRRTPFLQRQEEPFTRRESASLRHGCAGMSWRLTARREEVIIEITYPSRQLLAERLRPAFGARPLGRVIEDKVKRPLTEELLFGALENGAATVDAEGGEVVMLYAGA